MKGEKILFWSVFSSSQQTRVLFVTVLQTHTFSSLILSASTLGDWSSAAIEFWRLDLPNLGPQDALWNHSVYISFDIWKQVVLQIWS